MFKKIVLNQGGMSLVEVMVAIGISSIVSMGVMKINETSTKGMNHTSTKFSLNEFRRAHLAMTLSKPENCKANFENKVVSSNLASANFVVANKIVTAGTSPTEIAAVGGKTPEGDWTINTIQLDAFQPSSTGSFTGICNLQVNLTRNKMAFGGTTQGFTLPLYCMVNSSFAITTCMSASAANSDIWAMNYRTGYEFINYVPAAGLGYVVVGPVADGEEVNASLTIKQEGFDWRGFPPFKEGLRLPFMNVITWDRWGLTEGISHSQGGSLSCFKMANFPTDTALNQQAEFCPTFASFQSLNGSNYSNHVYANRGSFSLLPFENANTTGTGANNSTARIDLRDGSLVIDYNFQTLNPVSGALSINRKGTTGYVGAANKNGGGLIDIRSSGVITLGSVPAGQSEDIALPMLFLDPIGIIGSNNSKYYGTTQLNDFNLGTTARIPSIIIGHSNKGGLPTDTAPVTPHGTEASIIVGVSNVSRSQNSFVMGLSNEVGKDNHFAQVMGTFNLIEGTGTGRSYYLVNGDQNIFSNSGYGLIVGNSNLVQGMNSIGIGSSNWINGSYSQTIGKTNVANANYSMAIGQNNLAAAVYSYAHGYANEAGGISSFAFGNTSQALGNYSFASGSGAKALGTYALAIGYAAEAQDINSVAIGQSAVSRSTRGIAIGYGAETKSSSAVSSMAIGFEAEADQIFSLALGNRAKALGAGSVAISSREQTNSTSSITEARGTGSVAIGRGARAIANNSIAISSGGWGARAGGNRSILSGADPLLTPYKAPESSTVIGHQAAITGFSNNALGLGNNLQIHNCVNCSLIGSSPWTTEVLQGPTDATRDPSIAGVTISGDYTTRVFAAGTVQIKVQHAPPTYGQTDTGADPWYNTGGFMCQLSSSGAPNWQCSSDRNLKENFREVDEELILDNLTKLGVTTWNMKGTEFKTRSIGPVAQDFYQLFTVPLGLQSANKASRKDDDTHISQSTVNGVLLVAAKNLILSTRKLEQENAELKREIAQIKQQQKAMLEAMCSIDKNLAVCK
jgi:prepilin-type N-terminal cleavage/methylation domain-containing protein